MLTQYVMAHTAYSLRLYIFHRRRAFALGVAGWTIHRRYVMSKEAALAFIKKASENADLQKKIIAFAGEQGYQFTVEELSAADLDSVVGGAGWKFKLD
jgi:hypothetical protein